ncbi:hypothetical protein ACFWY6_01825 [Streptomyces sp. NPDC059037]|uniref:hypothetical protein n=1 Tax=Streptomyces sp. NPDC059037 TaxID=3346710 RepID=UPI0036920449
MDRYFWHLSTSQADGVTCVVCGADFLRKRVDQVVVGREPATDSQVYACKAPCTAELAAEADRMAREMRTAAGLEAVDALADTYEEAGLLGADGEFGYLLRDLRVLVGAEAMLAVLQDLPTIRFVLQMTAVHAETAMTRARMVLARDQHGEA